MERRYDLSCPETGLGGAGHLEKGRRGHSHQRDQNESRQGSLSAHEVWGHYCGGASGSQVFFLSWEKALVAKHILQIWER